MLTIRLQRAGKKNQPDFRVILADKTAAATKKFVEILGNYNPHTKNLVIRNEDRLKYWLTQGVEVSPTVNNLFVTKNIIEGKKTKAFSIPKKVEAVAESTAEPVAERQEPEAETPAEAPAPTPVEDGEVGAPTENVGVETPTEEPVTEEAPAPTSV